MWDEYTKLVTLFGKCSNKELVFVAEAYWLDCCAAQAKEETIPCHTRTEIASKHGYVAILLKIRAIIEWLTKTYDGDKCECILKVASPLQCGHQVRVSADCIILWWALAGPGIVVLDGTSRIFPPTCPLLSFFSLRRRVSFQNSLSRCFLSLFFLLTFAFVFSVSLSVFHCAPPPLHLRTPPASSQSISLSPSRSLCPSRSLSPSVLHLSGWVAHGIAALVVMCDSHTYGRTPTANR